MAKLAIFLLAFLAIAAYATAESEVVCWGDTGLSVLAPPEDDFSSIDADASADVACGLQDGSPICWGNNAAGHVTGAPTDDNDYVSISVGGTHACALREDGEVVCWGTGASSNTAELGDFKHIASGDDHSCGIYDDEQDDDSDSDVDLDDLDVDVDDLDVDVDDVDVDSGVDDSDVTNTVCWGDNFSGELNVPLGGNYDELQLGDDFSCGRDDDDGQITCWGATSDLDFPAEYNADEFAVGNSLVCIVDDGTLNCWGNEIAQPNGIAPPEGDDYHNVYVGDDFGCALKDDHELECWGPDTDEVITNAPTDTKFDELALGNDFACGRVHHGGSSPARRPSSVFSALLN